MQISINLRARNFCEHLGILKKVITINQEFLGIPNNSQTDKQFLWEFTRMSENCYERRQ